MDSPRGHLATLDARRVALGMTISALARRANVSPSTVERVLSGRYAAASFKAVERIAAALGAAVRIEPVADIDAMRVAQAKFKTEQQLGPSNENASETERLREAARRDRAVHRWLAGSNRKLWSD